VLSPDPLPGRRSRHVFSVHKHFPRRVFQRRAPSTSPSHPPANGEQPQLALKVQSRAVNIDEEHGNVNVSPFFWYSYHGTSNMICCQSSEDVKPETTGCGNGKVKQQELIARIQASSSNVRSSPAESSRSSAAYPPSHRSRPPTARRVWAMINLSRHHPPVSESTPLYP